MINQHASHGESVLNYKDFVSIFTDQITLNDEPYPTECLMTEAREGLTSRTLLSVVQET